MKCWALIAAAGAGRRMGIARPKQYLPLANSCVIEHSLKLFIAHETIQGLVVVLADDDTHWSQLMIPNNKPLLTVTGGAERVDSVLAGLQALAEHAGHNDWVLVHDAARPCLTSELLNRLFDELMDDPVGGLLAVPASDTLKQAHEHRVTATLERKHIWQAQTPQMFRLGLLRKALENARESGVEITDESMAVERLGHQPKLVPSSTQNIKITRPEDLSLAEFILQQQARL